MDERHDFHDEAVGVEMEERVDETGEGDESVVWARSCCGRVFLPLLNSGCGSSSGWMGDATGSGGNGLVWMYRLGFLRGIGGVRQRVKLWAIFGLVNCDHVPSLFRDDR